MNFIQAYVYLFGFYYDFLRINFLIINNQEILLFILIYKYIYIHKNTKFNIIMSKLNINDLLTSLPKTENTQ